MKWITPLTESRTGAVKTSPSGMFTFPSHGIAGMPRIEKDRSVSSGPFSRTRSVCSISFFSGCIARDIFA